MKFALNKSIDKLEEIDELIFSNGIEGLRGVAKKGQFVCPYCEVKILIMVGDKY